MLRTLDSGLRRPPSLGSGPTFDHQATTYSVGHDSDASLITSGRFGPLSSEDEESVNVNRAPTELLEVMTVPQSIPTRPARFRLLKRMSQTTTEVAPWWRSRSPRRKCPGDNDDEERDPDIRVLNPVEFDDDSDCVLDALQRDLEVDVASACPGVADASHFGRVAVQVTPSQDSQPVAKRCGWWREATSIRPPCHQRHEPPN